MILKGEKEQAYCLLKCVPLWYDNTESIFKGCEGLCAYGLLRRGTSSRK